jgi:hypothetical protein
MRGSIVVLCHHGREQSAHSQHALTAHATTHASAAAAAAAAASAAAAATGLPPGMRFVPGMSDAVRMAW